jgi:hypothetical protein
MYNSFRKPAGFYHKRTKLLRVGGEAFLAPLSSVQVSRCLSGPCLKESVLYMSTMPFAHDKEGRIGMMKAKR